MITQLQCFQGLIIDWLNYWSDFVLTSWFLWKACWQLQFCDSDDWWLLKISNKCFYVFIITILDGNLTANLYIRLWQDSLLEAYVCSAKLYAIKWDMHEIDFSFILINGSDFASCLISYDNKGILYCFTAWDHLTRLLVKSHVFVVWGMGTSQA